MLRSITFAVVGALSLAVVAERDAHACGGCFVRQVERTVVTDHRMAFAISPTQTVLWDQIRYSGDPSEFAWVLPVHQGARIEVSNDAFFAALDASTQPTVASPPFNGGRGYGCALTGCSSSGASGDNASGGGGGQVQVVSEQVVGPYETVTLRSTDPNALVAWLTEHAYDIPPAIQPTIDAYVSEGFDFIALRLVPNCGERSMRPVRIVTPGADASLPLRMVAAGVGANVGIALYVIGEGRYRPQNFPEGFINESALTWDQSQGRSNYDELSQNVMAGAGGRTWLTEASGEPDLTDDGYYNNYYASSTNPGLAEAYYSLCRPSYYGGNGGTTQPPPCTSVLPPLDQDAGADAGSSDAGDASDDGAVDGDASTYPTFNPAYAPPYGCEAYDDIAVALTGMHAPYVWVTRMRAELPVDALAVGDLRLEASPSQTPVTNTHSTSTFNNSAGYASAQAACGAGSRTRETFGTLAIAGAIALGVAAGMRRRTRR
jgi:hypothetical protein